MIFDKDGVVKIVSIILCTKVMLTRKIKMLVLEINLVFYFTVNDQGNKQTKYTK